MEVECSAITDPSGSFKMNSLTAGIYTLHLQKSSAGEGDGTAGATTYLPLILPNIPVGGDAVVSQEIPPLFLEPGIRSRDLGDAISDCDGDGKIDMAPGQADCQEFCHDQEDCQVICDQDNDNDGIPNQKEDNHCWCQPAGATYDPLVQSCRALVGDGVKRMPVARIEPQTRLEVEQGAKVDLDGSKSFSPNFGKSALQYHWTILKSPFSTTDKISSANVAKTTLTVSQVGIYQVQLQVSKNGVLSEPDRLIIDSKKPSNYPPKVKVQILDSSGQPLKDNRVPVNSKITLDGSGSSDPDPDDNMFLEYAWSIDKKPTGSTLAFERADIGKVEIKLDKKGEYGFTLTVKDLANHEVSESFTVEGY